MAALSKNMKFVGGNNEKDIRRRLEFKNHPATHLSPATNEAPLLITGILPGSWGMVEVVIPGDNERAAAGDECAT